MLNSTVKILADTMLDFSFLAVLYTVNSVEDFSVLLKMFTSSIVFILAVARLYYFCKDNMTKKEDNEKIEHK
jgi:hypothetical protein